MKAGFWSVWKKNPTRDKQAAAQRNLKCPSTHVFISPVGFSKADQHQVSVFPVSLSLSRLICQCHVFMCLPDSRQVPWKVDERELPLERKDEMTRGTRFVCAYWGGEKRTGKVEVIFLFSNSWRYSMFLLSSPQTVAEINHTFFKTLKMNQMGAHFCTDALSGDRINSDPQQAIVLRLQLFQSWRNLLEKRPNVLRILTKSSYWQRLSSG